MQWVSGRESTPGLSVFSFDTHRAQCVCSGEHKAVDRFGGDAAEDTGITSVFIGPRRVGAYGKLSGELAAEFPLSIHGYGVRFRPIRAFTGRPIARA